MNTAASVSIVAILITLTGCAFVARLDDQHYWQADAYRDDGEALQRTERYLEAAQAYASSAEVEQHSPAPRVASLAIVLNQAGLCYEKLGQYQRAFDYFTQALELTDRLDLLYRERFRAGLLNNLGGIYESWGEYKQALTHHQQALEIAVTRRDQAATVTALNNIGVLYQNWAYYAQALEYFEQVRQSPHAAKNDSVMGTALNNLGTVYAELGEYERALDYHGQALKLARSHDRDESVRISLNNIGAVHLYRGEYAEALDWFEQALALARKSGADQSIAVYLSNIAAVHGEQGRYEQALEYAEQALELARRIDRDESIATALNNLGALFSAQGRFPQALDYYEQALERDRAAGRERGAATALNNLGLIYFSQSAYDQALESYEQSLAVARQIGDKRLIITALTNIGAVYRQRGRYEDAAAAYAPALELARESGNAADIATILRHLGGLSERRGRYPEALETFEQALALERKLGQQAGIAAVLNEMGNVYSAWGQYDRALDYYQQALELNRGMGRTSAIATNLNYIGDAYAFWGKYTRALAYFEDALELERAMNDAAGIVACLNNIGVTHSHLGYYATALHTLEQGLDVAREIDHALSVASLLNNIGTIYYTLQRYEAAFDHIEQALDIAREIGAQASMAVYLDNMGSLYAEWGHDDAALEHYAQALEIARRAGLRDQVATSLTNIGGVSYEREAYADAVPFLVEAIDIIEELRQTASGELRRDYFAKERNVYTGLITCYLRANDFAQAFETIERSRAKLLAEQLAGFDAEVDIPSLEQIRRNLPDDTAVLIYVSTELEREVGTVSLLITHEAVTATQHPVNSFVDTVMGAHGPVIDQVLTDAGKTTLRTYPQEDVDGSPITAEQQLADHFAQILEFYRYAMTSSSSVRGPDIVPDEQHVAWTELQRDLSRQLYDALFADIHARLPDTTHLLIVPDGMLNVLPFETLRDERGRYLIEQYTVQYAQSLTVLDIIAKRRYDPARRPLLAFGGAVYQPRDYQPGAIENQAQLAYLHNAAKRSIAQDADLHSLYQTLDYGAWRNLPGTLHEVEAIERVVPDAVVMVGGAVTESAIKRLSAQGELAAYKVLHFATHGLVVPEIPELSSLVLSVEPAGPEDGYLRAGEIARLELRADFVNLSACDTGLGKLYNGEGVVGLTQAFLLAGANGLAVSLWQVSDLSTARFMAAFYELAHQHGRSYVEALTEVKRRFIRGEFGEPWQAPYYWAPFVYYGQ
jgi:tetratricopeptide (TPR) repeat protein